MCKSQSVLLWVFCGSFIKRKQIPMFYYSNIVCCAVKTLCFRIVRERKQRNVNPAYQIDVVLNFITRNS